MKKVCLIFTLLFSLNSFAQNPNLLGEWFLHTITENGSSPIVTTPYIYDLNFDINGTDSSIYNNTGGTDCDAFEAFSTFPSGTDLVIQLTGLTLGGGCGSSSGGLYLGTLFSDPYNLESHNYIITGTGSNEALTLTNSSNDVLLFGRQVLSVSEKLLNNLSIVLIENPVDDILNLSISKQISANLYYAIYSIDGKTIRNYSLFNNDKIDVEYLNSGIYFLSIKTKENQPKMIKFMKR